MDFGNFDVCRISRHRLTEIIFTCLIKKSCLSWINLTYFFYVKLTFRVDKEKRIGNALNRRNSSKKTLGNELSGDSWHLWRFGQCYQHTRYIDRRIVKLV